MAREFHPLLPHSCQLTRVNTRAAAAAAAPANLLHQPTSHGECLTSVVMYVGMQTCDGVVLWGSGERDGDGDGAGVEGGDKCGDGKGRRRGTRDTEM